MKYIVCEQPLKFSKGDKEEPTEKTGEALLKIHRIGICGTDLHAYTGNQPFFKYPRILGHELAAEILEIGENEQGLKAGDKVIIMPYVSCGECIACENGKTNCCKNIQVLGVHADGGMQEVISVRQDLLLPANDFTYDEMAIVEPLAIGAHAIRRADIKKGETIVVMGCGPIGIGLMKLAQIRGAKVIAMDVNPTRLEYAKKEIGVDYIVNVTENPVDKVEAITKGEMAATVFDATGNKKALESGPDYMAHGGKFVLVGLFKGELNFEHPKIHAKETTLMCSRNATLEDFKFVTDNLKSFPTDSFITHRVKFDEMIDNFDSWLLAESNVIKAMIEV